MKTYIVEYNEIVTNHYDIFIEANSPEEAREIFDAEACYYLDGVEPVVVDVRDGKVLTVVEEK